MKLIAVYLFLSGVQGAVISPRNSLNSSQEPIADLSVDTADTGSANAAATLSIPVDAGSPVSPASTTSAEVPIQVTTGESTRTVHVVALTVSDGEYDITTTILGLPTIASTITSVPTTVTSLTATTTEVSVSSLGESSSVSVEQINATSTSMSSSEATSFTETLNATSTAPSASTSTSAVVDQQLDALAPHFDVKCGQGVKLLPGEKATLDDVDQCILPGIDVLPVTGVPISNLTYRPIQTAGQVMWNWLRMDEWIDQTLSSCSILGDVWTDVDPPQKVAWSRGFARLIHGRTDYGAADVGCTTTNNAASCKWIPYQEDNYSCRGRIWGIGGVPEISANPTAADIMAYRRWLAFQAMYNLMEYNLNAQAMMQFAANTATARLPGLVADFYPDYKAPTYTPAPSLFGDILTVVNAIASFTPIGPEVALALQLAAVVSDGASGDVPSGTKDANTLAGTFIKYDGKMPSDRKKPTTYTAPSPDMEMQTPQEMAAQKLSEAQKAEAKKQKEAAENARTAMTKNIASALSTITAVGQLYIDASKSAQTTPGKWTSPLPIAFTELANAVADTFLAAKLAMDRATVNAMNGDPRSDGGYYTMVKGGLFASEQSVPDDQVNESELAYIAYLEDEIVKMIFKSHNVFIVREDFPTPDRCESNKAYLINGNQDPNLLFIFEGTNWQGVECVTWDDGSASMYVPYVSAFGNDIAGEGKHAYRPAIQQIYPQFALANHSIHTAQTAKFNLPMDQIYRAIDACAQQTIIPQFNSGATQCNTDGTSPLGLWPSSFNPDSTTISMNKLAETCHWNIPLLVKDSNFDSVAVSHLEDYSSMSLNDYGSNKPPGKNTVGDTSTTWSVAGTYINRWDGTIEWDLHFDYLTHGNALTFARSLLGPVAGCGCGLGAWIQNCPGLN